MIYDDREITCAECEELMSRACDGECSEDEKARLDAHLKSCDACASLMREYRLVRDMMITKVVLDSCPPPPTVTMPRSMTSPFVRRALAAVGALAACFAFFFFGRYLGYTEARSDYVEYLSPMVVSTPSMWSASRPTSAQFAADVDSEVPFTSNIMRYRAAVADELRRGNVDWVRVRGLLEAMGELRTDLELLTIHLAFLEINTGSSPNDVAAHWESLGGRDAAWR